MHRFILDKKSIRNKKIVFNSDQSRKIRKVLRLKIGEEVEVFDGRGWVYRVRLIKVRQEESIGEIITQDLLSDNKHNITIYQAFPKHVKIKFILQKCTELGVDKIIFFKSEYSQIKTDHISNDRTKRWQKIVSYSTEQSRRIFAPEIEINKDFDLDYILNSLTNTQASVLLLDKNGQRLNQIIENLNLSNLHVFVGPEGGFSKRELLIFDKYNIDKVSISNNNLRTETAGMAFLSQLNLFI